MKLLDERLLLSFEDLEAEHWWFRVRRSLVLDATIEACPLGTRRVLEVGCGTGSFLDALQQALPGVSVSGVEPNERAVQAATMRGRDVRLSSFVPLGADTGSIDMLVALDVLEHCEDDEAALAEVNRALRPGGRLLMTVPALPSLWSEHDVVNQHYRRYTRLSLRRPLDQAGLRVQRMTYFNGLLLPLGLVSRWSSRLSRGRTPLGVQTPPHPINLTLMKVFSWERQILKRTDIPFGMSLLVIAEKPGEVDARERAY